MPKDVLILLGASAGGVETLTRLFHALPGKLPAIFVVILHTPANSSSVLPQIIARAGAYPASHASHGEHLQPGHVYVAPPNHHLLIRAGYVELSMGPKINGHRPSIDITFQTAAEAYGTRAVGVILSGSMDDGVAGLIAVKEAGGRSIVQDPKEALFPGMPSVALQRATVDDVLQIEEIAQLLEKLISSTLPEPLKPPDLSPPLQENQVETHTPTSHPATSHPQKRTQTMQDPGSQGNLSQMDADRSHFRRGDANNLPRTLLTCPGCGGVLWEMKKDDHLQYHCQIGHIYSEESFIEQQGTALETALWMAMRALEERAHLALRLANRSSEQGRSRSVSQFEGMANDSMKNASVIRKILEEGKLLSLEVPIADGDEDLT